MTVEHLYPEGEDKSKIWTTKEGREIPIEKLADSHLINIIKHLRRNATFGLEKVRMNPPCFQGEMAQYYAEQEWEIALGMDAEEFLEYTVPQYEYLLEELRLRGLEV